MSTVILKRRNTIIRRKTFFLLLIFYQIEQELNIFLSLPEEKNIIFEGTILFIKHRNVVYLSYENLCLYHVSLYFLYSTRKYSSMKYTLYAYDIYYKIIFFNVGGKLYNILYTIWQRTFLFFCTSKYIVHTRMSIVTIEEGLN